MSNKKHLVGLKMWLFRTTVVKGAIPPVWPNTKQHLQIYTGFQPLAVVVYRWPHAATMSLVLVKKNYKHQ